MYAIKAGRKRRGSALMAVFVVAAVLSGVALYLFETSTDATVTSNVREHVDNTAAVAEYGLEMAISQLGNVEKRQENGDEPTDSGVAENFVIEKDWVAQHPYEGLPPARRDQRRIGGTVGEGDVDATDYRVRVRSVGAARELNTMPDRWLSGYNPDFTFGATALRDFNNVYEITSTARSRLHADSAGRAATSTVSALVEMDFYHILNDQGNAATLNARPGYFRNSGTVDADGNLLGAGPLSVGSHSALAEPDGSARFDAIQVSGEDHYGTKTVISNTSSTETIDEVVSIAGNDSQLFSILTSTWDAGQMTMHFQRGDTPNPLIPRTSTLNRYANDPVDPVNKQVVARDSAREHDQYFYGGKRDPYTNYSKTTPSGSAIMYGYGRSVNLINDETEIQETTVQDVLPGGANGYDFKALAIGRSTDFSKLYLNFTNANHPANNAFATEVETWKAKWTQLPISYVAQRTSRMGQSVHQIPLDNYNSPTKRRQTAKFWIKNQNGQFLARDYRYPTGTKNIVPGVQTPGALAAGNYNSTSHWTGYYAWYNYYGYTNSDSRGGGKFHLGYGIPYAGGVQSNGSLVSGNTKNWILHTRFLTLEELFGYELEKGPDGLPAAFNDSGAVVGGVPQFLTDEDGNKIPYRPNRERNGGVTQFDEVAQRATTHGDNWGVATNHEAVYPPLDGIYVVSRNPARVGGGNMILDSNGRPAYERPNADDPEADAEKRNAPYRLLQDFAFQQNVAAAGEPEDLRDMVNIQMVIETVPEGSYTSGSTNLYWDMGLAVTIVFDKVIEGQIDYVAISDGRNNNWWEGLRQESMSGDTSHYAVKIDVPDGVLDIEDLQERLLETYNAMQLNGDLYENLYSMVDGNGELTTFPRAKFLWSDGALGPKGKLVVDESRPDAVYYYSDDDVERFISRVADGAMRDEWAADEAIDPKEKAVELMYAVNADIPGLDLRHIDRLYDPGSGYFKSYLTGDLPSSLKPGEPYVSDREFAMRVFGRTAQILPAVYATDDGSGTLSTVTKRDLFGPGVEHPGDPVDPTSVTLSYLPSEYLADEGGSELDHGKLVVNNPEHIDSFNTNVNLVQPSGRPIEFKIYDENDYRELIRTPPDWLDYEGIKAEYGLLEARSRGGIGWHRGGPFPGADDPDHHAMDHYEYVIIGKKGFMPYREHDGAIALIASKDYDRNDPEQVLNKSLDFEPQLKPPEELPTFVISSEGLLNPRDNMPVFTLDGAGILVVNGNLEVRANFAYHGTLVVLGDIHVEPELRPVYLKDSKGNNLDETGERIVYDNAGEFYYVDDEGVRVPVEWPAYTESHEAKLIVQGQVFLGGAITTFSGEKPDARGELRHVSGGVDIRASRQAVQETSGILMSGKEMMRIRRIGWSDNVSDAEERYLWEGTERD